MKTDYESCEKCGCVIDIEVLKQLEEKKTQEQRDKEDYDSSYQYRDYYSFEKFKCPCCKYNNQR